MKENIEVKDVQKTEYLDKNGLDMLWTKVKENTHNQVEVEYNRAKAKEDSLSQEIASVKPSEGKVFLQAEATEDARILEDYVFSFGDYRTGVYAGAAAKGFFVQKDTEEVEVSSTGIKADVERESDTKVWNTNGGITDLTNYAKKTDIPEVDTSDFVSKTTTDAQIINSSLGIVGGGIQMIDYTADSDPVSLELSSSALAFDGCDRSTITLNASDVNSNNGSRIIIEAYNENPHITLQSNVGSDFAFHNNLTITNEGISNSDNNANHVYATDGSIADLTQYANAAALNNYVLTTALDKQVDTLNAAISGKQDAGNYIPYKNIAFKNKYVIEPSYSIEFRTYALNNKYGKAFIGPQTISITSASGQHAAVEPEEISVRQSGNASGTIHSTLNADSFGVYNNYDDSVIFKLNQYGIKLEDGDNNHVLTSNASTIDITQYVLKSVYDEKIAALEARIAALEPKHAETA